MINDVHAFTHTHTPIRPFIYTHTQEHTQPHTQTHTHIHTDIDTDTLTHSFTHTTRYNHILVIHTPKHDNTHIVWNEIEIDLFFTRCHVCTFVRLYRPLPQCQDKFKSWRLLDCVHQCVYVLSGIVYFSCLNLLEWGFIMSGCYMVVFLFGCTSIWLFFLLVCSKLYLE